MLSCLLSPVVLATCRIKDLLERINESVVATILDLIHLLAPVLITRLLTARLLIAHQEVLAAACRKNLPLGRARSLTALVTRLVRSDKQARVIPALETVTTSWSIAYGQVLVGLRIVHITVVLRVDGLAEDVAGVLALDLTLVGRIFVQVLHALVLHEVGELAGDCLGFRDSQLVNDVLAVDDEEQEEDAEDDVDRCGNWLRVHRPHQQERAHMEAQQLKQEEHEALL